MHRLSRREQQLVTRQRLKQSGLEAMAFRGVQAARIEHVARDAGLTKGAFYAHFSDKLAMTLEILQDLQASELAYWEAMLDAATDYSSCLDDVICRSGDASRAHGLISLELHLEAERDEAFRPHFLKYIDNLHAEVGRVLTKVLRRHGKAAPDNLHEAVVEMYLIGLSPGLSSYFGSGLNAGSFISSLLRQQLERIIAAAPDLTDSERCADHSEKL